MPGAEACSVADTATSKESAAAELACTFCSLRDRARMRNSSSSLACSAPLSQLQEGTRRGGGCCDDGGVEVGGFEKLQDE